MPVRYQPLRTHHTLRRRCPLAAAHCTHLHPAPVPLHTALASSSQQQFSRWPCTACASARDGEARRPESALGAAVPGVHRRRGG